MKWNVNNINLLIWIISKLLFKKNKGVWPGRVRTGLDLASVYVWQDYIEKIHHKFITVFWLTGLKE